MGRRSQITSVVVVLIGMLATAACGGGSSTKTSASVTTSLGATLPTGPSTTAHFSGSSSSTFCNQVRSLQNTTKVNPSADLKTTFQAFDSVASQVGSSAPSAIKADIVILIEGLRKLRDALAAANYDFTKVDPATLQSLQDPKFKASTDRVNAYVQQVCGVNTTPTS